MVRFGKHIFSETHYPPQIFGQNHEGKLASSLAKRHLKLSQRRKTNPFGLKVYKRGGISRVEVQKSSGKLLLMHLKGPFKMSPTDPPRRTELTESSFSHVFFLFLLLFFVCFFLEL